MGWTIEEIVGSTASKTFSSADVVRYLAPELVVGGSVPPTTNSDTYAFALLVLECFTEEQPFPKLKDHEVIHKRFVNLQCPLQPDEWHSVNHAPGGLWDLMKLCWSLETDLRPSITEVHKFFSDCEAQQKKVSSTA